MLFVALAVTVSTVLNNQDTKREKEKERGRELVSDTLDTPAHGHSKSPT